MFFLCFIDRILRYQTNEQRGKKMKKIIAFALSVSMCLSMLTVLAPAFAYEQGAEQTVQMRTTEQPVRKPDPDREIIHAQHDNV